MLQIWLLQWILKQRLCRRVSGGLAIPTIPQFIIVSGVELNAMEGDHVVCYALFNQRTTNELCRNSPICPISWLFSSTKYCKDGMSYNQDGIVPFNKLSDNQRCTKLEGIWLTDWLLEGLFEEETCVRFVERSGSWPMKLLPERSNKVSPALFRGSMDTDHQSYYMRGPKKLFVWGLEEMLDTMNLWNCFHQCTILLRTWDCWLN